MRIEHAEVIWLDETHVYSLTEMAELSGLAAAELSELVACGVLVSADREREEPAFSARSITIARTARRMRDDFELDMQGLSVALTLLRRIGELESELCNVRAHLSRPM